MIRMIIALLGVGGAIALFFLYTKPAYDGVEALESTNESYDLALQKAAELQNLKQSLLSRYNSFNREDIERLNKLLPDHVDNVRLVLDLDSLASKHNIALQNITVTRPNAETSSSETIGPTRQAYDSVTLKFATSGTYENFKSFLLDLENSLRIVDLIGLTINADTAAAGEAQSYRFDVTLRTYWLK